MKLTARLNSPRALYRKLERESYRAFHAPSPLHKADHFFNFCVTAASMRDYCLEHCGATTQAQKQKYHDTWSKIPLLIAASEIANSTKHFVLRDPSGAEKPIRTRGARLKRSKFVDIYLSDSGEHMAVPAMRSEVTITLSDGKRLELFQFTRDTLAYWKQYLSTIGIRVRRQPFNQLAA